MPLKIVPALLAVVAAAGAVLLVSGARSGCAPAPVACEPGCVAADRAENALCGHDGATYATFCDLKCAIGGFDCLGVDDCPDVFYADACRDECYVRDELPADVGGALPAFLCRDLNTRSASSGDPYSDIVLAEQVWIAYFGSCT